MREPHNIGGDSSDMGSNDKLGRGGRRCGWPTTKHFLKIRWMGSYISAKTVVPHVISLCHAQSVGDFGCGVGSWVRACQECEIADVTGIDGDYVDERLLMIPRARFVKADLTRPLDLGRRFDLVISLEVAEHLPPNAAGIFVDTLTRHGSVILFSAAVPGQGGVRHVNEQWGQYWSSTFAARGYACVDCLRDIFWDKRSVDWWYRQNMSVSSQKAPCHRFRGSSRKMHARGGSLSIWYTQDCFSKSELGYVILRDSCRALLKYRFRKCYVRRPECLNLKQYSQQ